MKKGSKKSEMSIMEAVENLSSMAELDIQSEMEDIRSKLQTFKNLKKQEKEETLETVKKSFKTLHKYLATVYQKDQKSLRDVEMQKGVKAIMVLADEAVEKLKRCTSLFQHTYQEGKIEEIKEYKDLQSFYTNKIMKRFEQALAKEEAWEEEWRTESGVFDIKKLGLKDLETVKRDKQYELFYIRKDDGKPFFNHNLLRHIKLVSHFDHVLSAVEGEDPLLRVNVLIDKEAQAAAEEIRGMVKEELGEFYLEALQHLEIPTVRLLNQVTVSLLLASNPRNSLQFTSGKTCTRYFQDFQENLRKILASDDYSRLAFHSLSETDHLSRSLIQLVHAYCYAYFVNVRNRKNFLEYLSDLFKRSGIEKNKKNEAISSIAFWNDLLETHDAIGSLLKQYPSGPLFKTIDIFHNRNEKEGFDPLFQGNHPHSLFIFSSEAFDSTCLRLPCPTLHHHVNKAEVTSEFKGHLLYLESKKQINKHLFFNLQNSTFLEEHARCKALEDLQKQASFSKQFVLVTLPKGTDFYQQTENYKDLGNAEDFIKLIKEQIDLGAECGFFFPRHISKDILHDFIKKALTLIYTFIFGKKVELNRQQRLDFLEIFYHLLMLKILDLVKPDYFSFTCKDGIDSGAITSAGFCAVIKMLSLQKSYSKEEQEHLLWMLFRPSLLIRERLVDIHGLSRMLSAMTTFFDALKKDEKKFIKSLESLYDYPLFQKLQIKF